MKKFIRKSVVLIVLPAIILFTIGILIQRRLDEKIKTSNISSEYVEWNDIFNGSINADVLVQGSSRAWVQFDPRLIDSFYRVNSYNLGMAAYPFDAQYCRFKCYIENNVKPKVIIQCVDYNLFSKTRYYFHINQFIPYLSNNHIRDFINESGQLNFADFNLPLCKYRWIEENNSSLFSSFVNTIYFGIRTPVERIEGIKYKGFQAQDKHWGETKLELNKQEDKRPWKEKYFEEEPLKYFDDFVRYCQDRKIQLILVYPPEYYDIRRKVENYQSVKDKLSQIAKQYDLHYLDYGNIPMNFDTSFFYDYRHLNSKGVKVFNQLFVCDLASIIKL
jgi:hypothetical protein